MDKNASTTLLARARPDRSTFWVSVFMLSIVLVPLGLSLFIPARPGETQNTKDSIYLLGCALLLGVPSILAIVWTWRAEVRADERGLRWRGLWHGWRECRWDEISDYYETLSPSNRKSKNSQSGKEDTRLHVITQQGKIVVATHIWKLDDLQEVVETHATKARTKSWRVLGMSPDLDWPMTFTYRTAENAFFVFSAPLLVCFFIVSAIWYGCYIANELAVLGPSMILFDIAIPVLALLPYGLMTAVLLPTTRDTFRRRHETITVTQDGIVWSSPKQQIQADWCQITEYQRAWQSNRFRVTAICLVHTKNGQITFTAHLKDVRVLCRIIQKFATQASTTEWPTKIYTDLEILDRNASRWSSGYEGMGDRVYHYRNRTCRAIFLYFSAYAMAPLLMTAFYHAFDLPIPRPSPWLLVASLGIPTYIWWRYRVGEIRTNDNGITRNGLWRKHSIAWSDVQSYRMIGQDVFRFGTVTGSQDRVKFWKGITDLEELKAEITRRAVNCPHGTWETAAAPKKSKVTT